MVKMVHNWRRGHRMLSVQLAALGATLSFAWLALPEDAKAGVLASLHIEPTSVSLMTFVAIILGRLVSQPAVEGDERG